MARTALTVDELVANSNLDDPAGTLAHADGNSIDCVLEELVVRAVVANAETDITFLAGDHPPALAAGQGNLLVAAGVGTHWFGPFDSSRFLQSDGTIHVDTETEANVTFTAFHVPRAT